MEKPKVGTKNLERLLVVDGYELQLDSSFQSSEPTSLPGEDTALNLRYGEKPEKDAEKIMDLEVERVHEFIREIGHDNIIEVYGNNIKQGKVDGVQMNTPYVAIVGDIEWEDYN